MRPAHALVPLAVAAAAVTGVALFALSRPLPPPPPERKVRLAVLVVFDQMRGDYLTRWRPLFGRHGFARLQRDGAWFTHCHYPYGTTTTGPGHASMLTGACGDTHGIVNNNWFENGKGVYCAGRDRYELVPPPPPDPAKPAPKKDAKSPEPKEIGTPERLLSETVADVLKATHPTSRVFGLSLKDRSAILPTGKRPDGAFWFYGAFGTSTYYAGSVPPWVTAFNASKTADHWFGRDWTRARPDLDYTPWSGPDAAPGEGKGSGQGVTFPHPTTGGLKRPGPKYYEALAVSPFGNDLLLEFTKTCIDAEKLGTRDTPDLLVVSFSSNDLVGHTWGPDSQEVMDVTLRSDALVAEFLGYLDERVGKNRYLLAVTADHGICPLPEASRAQGNTGALRVEPAELQKELDAHLTTVFPGTKTADGKPAKWVEGFVFPWVYLNPRVVKASGRAREALAAESAKYLATRPGVARTFTRAELDGPVPAGDAVATRVKRSYHPARCGDVCVVLDPYCLPTKKIDTGTTHGSPYAYDTHVPLLVYGPGIRGGERDEPTTPQALAGIFAKYLNLRRPKDAAFPVPHTLE